MDSITGYLKMLRVRDWIKFYTFFPVAGAVIASGISLSLFSIFIIFACVIGYGFVVNNYFDVEIDRYHRKKAQKNTNPLVSNHVSRRGTLMLMALLVAIPLVLSASLHPEGFLLTCASIIALTLYSAEPFRLKDRVVLDILTHGLMFGGFPFLAGFALAGGLASGDCIFAVMCAVITTIVCFESLIAHQINDYDEDVWTARTTVVQIGRVQGGTLLAAMQIASIIVLEAITWYFAVDSTVHLILLAGLVLYPFYSCRWELLSGMHSTFRRILVACLNFQR